MKKYFIKTMLLICCVTTAFANDSLLTLNLQQVFSIVKTYHPVARLANLQIDKAKATKTISFSGFEPELMYGQSEKTLDNIDYYRMRNTQIRIPTWFGVELQAGVEQLTGERLDESQTPGAVSYAGLSVPLLKNLWFDKRRADLKLADVFVGMSIADQRSTLNDILYEASSAYWNWVKAFQVYAIVQKNVEVTRKRFDLMKRAYENGERAAIDTTEALTQLLMFRQLESQKWFEWQQACLELSSFLWTANNTPVQLPYTIKPENEWEKDVETQANTLEVDKLIELANREHPYLQNLQWKANQLMIERKLKFQELLPKADLQFNALGKGYSALQNSGAALALQNNYRVGLKMSMPLMFFRGRGEYKMASLKIQENKWTISQKTNQIHLKIKDYFNDFQNLKKLMLLQQTNVENFQRLLDAEQTRLTNGESSLFLVNSRENKALEAYEKLLEYKTKYYKRLYSLQWAAGIMQ